MDADTKPGVFACLRCKTRKIKCDREMPKCTPCARANCACLTIDPASGRQIPRSYLSHLESRVKELESELMHARRHRTRATYSWVPDIDSPYHGAASGFSLAADFSKMVLRDRADHRDRDMAIGTNMDLRRAPDAAAGKSLESRRLPVDLPTKKHAEGLMKLYFEKCNSIVPVLHREQFVKEFFEPIYGPISPDLQLCSNYTAIRLKRSSGEPGKGTFYRRWVDGNGTLASPLEPRVQVCLFFVYMVLALGSVTEQKLSDTPNEEGSQFQAASMVYYSVVAYAVGSSHNHERSLQALLLRAVYGVLIPSHPSAWYTAGTAVRMCIDMGLHKVDRHDHGPRESKFLLDMHRRLFWSAYYVDRLASVYLGRPVNIADEDIQCNYPLLADDSWLMPLDGNTIDRSPSERGPSSDIYTIEPLSTNPNVQMHSVVGVNANAVNQYDPEVVAPDRPSYKWVSRIMLQLRRIQHSTKSELYDRADFDGVADIRQVRDKIADELDEWYRYIPNDPDIFNFDFDRRFLDLSFFYTTVLLFRSSRGIMNPTFDETRRMLEAGCRVLSMYVEFHSNAEFAYSWAAIHNVMHAASSCLYGLYRTNALNGEYDLDSFEELMHKTMAVVDSLKTRCDTAPTAYDPLHAMTHVTLEYLRSRRVESASKRVRKVPEQKQHNDLGNGGDQHFPQATIDRPTQDPAMVMVPPAHSHLNTPPIVDSSAPQEVRVRQLMSHLNPMSNDTYFNQEVPVVGEDHANAEFMRPQPNLDNVAYTNAKEPIGEDESSSSQAAQQPPLVVQPSVIPPSFTAAENLNPTVPDFVEEQPQYSQLQVYDMLDEISQFFEGDSFVPAFP